jgi:hypothetical protein
MDKWLDSVPEHRTWRRVLFAYLMQMQMPGLLYFLVRWSPTMKDDVFANQAATLHAAYYLVRILVYRPLMLLSPSSLPGEATSFTPSFAADLCLEAASSCAKMVKGQRPRGYFNVPGLVSAAHVCAAMILAHVWDLKAKQKAKMELVEHAKPPPRMTIERLMGDVTVFIEALEWAAIRWENAAQYL